MRSHTIDVLGLEVSFKAEAGDKRIAQARALLEDRYAKIAQNGGLLSKEKLLTFLALALADDLIQMQEEKAEQEKKVTSLLVSIEKVSGNSPA